MHFDYQTDRLYLKVLNDTHADQSLCFYRDGAEVFNLYEPPKAPNFYTEDYQEALLRGEYEGFLSGNYIRYYLFRKEEPDRIIGTVSFSGFQKGAYKSCILGYKLLPAYWHCGYATEAIGRLVSALFSEDKYHRIEAFTLADNTASIALLERLGFSFEGVAHSIIRLKDGYTDHNRYYLINPMD